jgi:protein O-mannosyl-transferase
VTNKVPDQFSANDSGIAQVAPGRAPVRSGRVVLWFCLCLAIITMFVYAQVGQHSFINYDDHQYVVDNPHVTTGLTLENAMWAFRSGYAANWHPLTWMSHMLDCEFFGMDPGRHHLVSALLHTLNALLLFIVLFRMTGFVWRSCIVAALFALHPSHVESVAWIAERKDVLSAFFCLLAILAYHRYVITPSRLRYAIVAVCFTLGLMSKPTVVTLPFVLILLDYWPLERFRSLAGFWPRVWEKLPLFALSAVTSVVTFIAQQEGGAVVSIEDASIPTRIGNAVINYFFYLWKIFWPSPLFIPYWYDLTVGLSKIVGIAFAFLLLTAAVAKFGIHKRYLPTGWFWYIGTLVPMIGLVQVGSQSAADRYTYIPSIGVFILLTWGIADVCRHIRIPPALIAVGSSSIVGICAILSFRQIGYWKNSKSVFEHTLEVDPANLVAMNLLAWTYATDLDPHIRDGEKAVELASFTVEVTKRSHAPSLKVLAAGFAECRQFALAIGTIEEAMRLPNARSQPQLMARLEADLKQYKASRRE